MFSLFKSVKPNKFTKNELTAIRNTFNSLVKKYDDYEYEGEHLQEYPYKKDSYGFKTYKGEFMSVQIIINKRSFQFTFDKAGCLTKSFLKEEDYLKKTLIDFGYKEEKEINKEILAKIELIIKEYVQINAVDGTKYKAYKEILPRISIPIFYELRKDSLIMNDESKDSFKIFSKYYEKII